MMNPELPEPGTYVAFSDDWRDSGWTLLPNTIIRDRSLSRAAKGLAAELASYSSDYRIVVAEIVDWSSGGREATRNAIKELEAAGYLTRHQERDRYGRMGVGVYTLHRFPAEQPPSGSQGAGEPAPLATSEKGMNPQVAQGYREPGGAYSICKTNKDHPCADVAAPGAPQPVEDAGDGGLFAVEDKQPEKRGKGKQPDPVNVSAQALAKVFYDAMDGMCRFDAALGITKKALRAGYTEADIRDALVRIAEDGWTLTADRLRSYLRGGPTYSHVNRQPPRRDHLGRVTQMGE